MLHGSHYIKAVVSNVTSQGESSWLEYGVHMLCPRFHWLPPTIQMYSFSNPAWFYLGSWGDMSSHLPRKMHLGLTGDSKLTIGVSVLFVLIVSLEWCCNGLVTCPGLPGLLPSDSSPSPSTYTCAVSTVLYYIFNMFRTNISLHQGRILPSSENGRNLSRGCRIPIGLLATTHDWQLRVDLGGPLMFPQHIASSSIRPELVLSSDSLRQVVLLELTLGRQDWESPWAEEGQIPWAGRRSLLQSPLWA